MPFIVKNMKAIEKELRKIEKVEIRLCNQVAIKRESFWKGKLEEKIPNTVMMGLQKAFSKAFYLIFEKGPAIIEKTYDRDSIEKEFLINDYAMNIKGGKQEIAKLKRDAAGSNAIGTLITAVEGIGLGALGIGLPDIVIWVGMLLRGVYETSLKYGFDYETKDEKIFILKMLEAAMLTGEDWIAANEMVDAWTSQNTYASSGDHDLRLQIEKTANAFAADMLITKFIQGFPIVGMIGGVTNPVYYHKVMSYVQLKYRKRYLLEKKNILKK